LFYNRREDCPIEVDIRFFPKYEDAEIIKGGNPALKPQFTQSIELAYKTNWKKGYFDNALYLRIADGDHQNIKHRESQPFNLCNIPKR
jgi:outer membrane receptor protein involved in Fe transport